MNDYLYKLATEAKITFDLTSIQGTRTLWLSADFFADETSTSDEHRQRFSAQFSYAISTSSVFNDCRFNNSCVISAEAERYGGRGLSANIGSVRVANVGCYQIKGVGANILGGEATDHQHSYGGLDAFNGIKEIVLNNMLAKLMPMGVIKIHGLILATDEDKSFNRGGRRYWGTLLIRDATLRPAHFFRSMFFGVRSKKHRNLLSDDARVKRIYKALHKEIGKKKFIAELGQFLARSASQLAFARMARITHGALSESNMAFTAAWLDAGTACFTPGGFNLTRHSSFYAEASMPEEIATAMVYLYAKYNDVEINPLPLVDYYREQLEAYQHYHAGFLLGLTPDITAPFHSKADWLLVTKTLLEMIIDRNRSDCVLNFSNDFLTNRIASLIYKTVSYLPRPDAISNIAEKDFVLAACRVMNEIYNQKYKGILTNKAFYKLFAWTALKRCYLSAFFSISHIDVPIETVLSHKNPCLIPNFVMACDSLSSWIFSPPGIDSVILYKSDIVSLSYNAREDIYLLENFVANTKEFLSIDSVFSFIQNNKSLFVFLEFDFYPYLENAISAIKIHDKFYNTDKYYRENNEQPVQA